LRDGICFHSIREKLVATGEIFFRVQANVFLVHPKVEIFPAQYDEEVHSEIEIFRFAEYDVFIGL